MNVIVSNNSKELLSNLDIDIIKSISGEYEAIEIVDMFKNFFYNRMVLDVTAIKDFENIANFEILSKGLELDKIVFFLPEGSIVCTANFLSKLVSLGIYNFTTNFDGVKYLLNKPNTYEDVASIQKMGQTAAVVVSDSISSGMSGCKIIGFKNATVGAGATSLIYMIKNELSNIYRDNVIAIEIGKQDFQYFGDKNMISISRDDLISTVKNNQSKSVILIDLNDASDDALCKDIIYLLEPSVIKVNRLVKNKREFLGKLSSKKVVLNKCLLSSRDVSLFEKEAGLNSFYVIPPLNDRLSNDVIKDFCKKLDLLQGEETTTNGGIFGRFTR